MKMPWRTYTKIHTDKRHPPHMKSHKHIEKRKHWIKSNKPYKPRPRGLQKKSLWSSRFGLLELYNRKEQQQLICPSGYSISQCFNVLSKMWFAYHKAREEHKDIKRMEKYARAIQNIQKDMGIKTTSFPHLGIYGDVFILNDKQGNRVVFEDHSAMKNKQEEYEKWQQENSKEIQQHVQKPNKELGEEIEAFADDVYPGEKEEPEEDEEVPEMLEPDEEEEEEVIVMTDDIPFVDNYRNTKKTSLEGF